jgi:hypothetical protein
MAEIRVNGSKKSAILWLITDSVNSTLTYHARDTTNQSNSVIH